MKLARVRIPNGSAVWATIEQDGVRPIADYDPGVLFSLLADPMDASGKPTLPMSEVEFLCPIPQPPSVRDFMIFEDHVANARHRSGREVPPAWYEEAVFYFSNPASLIGPDEPLVMPRGVVALDLELEVACVIGREARDLPADLSSLEYVAGFMLMNDWSARDLQVKEMKVGLGPAKGKDFATSIGPWIVTKDELECDALGRFSCQVDAYVNDRHVGGADIATGHYTWPQILARASANTRLVPGDIIGSGTVGSGCLLELRELGKREENPWLRVGDVVELRGGVLGKLRNIVVSRTT